MLAAVQRSWRGGAGSYGATRIVTVPGHSTHPNSYPITNTVLGRQYQEFHNKYLDDLQDWDHQSILRCIRQISPEASHAITTYLRVIDSGYTIEVRKGNGEIHDQAQGVLTKWVNQIESPRIDRFEMPKRLRDKNLKWFLDVLIKGAIAGELILDQDLRPVDIAYVDPWSVEFFWDEENQRYIPRQWQKDGTVALDIPTFFYVPCDPLGNDPYGEEQITSAIRPAIFKMRVMQDLQQAIHTNAWKRLDFKVLEEAILANAPAAIKADAVKLEEFIQRHLNSIINQYKSLAPDDNLVHTDSVEVKGVEAGGGGSRGILDPTPLLAAIDNQIANGLKTFAVLLSKRFGGGTEGFTSSEMILYVKLIGGFQAYVESMIERAMTMALRFMGVMGNVDITFKKPELRSDMEMAQYKAVAIKNVSTAYDEQAIGEKERQRAIREIMGFTGPIPSDISDTRMVSGKDPNQPERPAESEEEKERRRAETNRQRRSGQGEE